MELSGCCLFPQPSVLGSMNQRDVAAHQLGSVVGPDAAEPGTRSRIARRLRLCAPCADAEAGAALEHKSVHAEQLTLPHLLCFTHWNIISNR